MMGKYFTRSVALKERKKICLSIFSLMLAIFGISPNAWAGNGPRIVIPINQWAMPDGSIKYSIEVAIGDNPANTTRFPAILDTGSSGLRIIPAMAGLPDIFKRSAYRATNTPDSETYGSGTVLNGIIANAHVMIDGLGGQVPIQVVHSAACSDQNPNCQGAEEVNAGLGLDSRNGQRGFYAIIGVGLRGTDIPNPFTAMGSGTWIIQLPIPGMGNNGQIIVNPNAADLAGYDATIQLSSTATKGITGWADNNLPACLIQAGTRIGFCGGAMLDSGAFNINAMPVENSKAPTWPQGTQINLELKRGMIGIMESFHVGALPASLICVNNANGFNLGPLLFYSFSVFYNSTNGVMRFKPNPPRAGVPSGNFFIGNFPS